MFLSDIFNNGYRSIFERAVVREMNIDDFGDCYGRRVLDMWRDFVQHLDIAGGIRFTESEVILERDTQNDFGCAHSFKHDLEVAIPLDSLSSVIKESGPMGWWRQGSKP